MSRRSRVRTLFAGRSTPSRLAAAAGHIDVHLVGHAPDPKAAVSWPHRARGEHARRADAEAAALSRLAVGVLAGHGDAPSLLEEVREMFGLAAVSLLERRGGSSWYVLASTGENPPEEPGAPGAEVSVAVSDAFVLAGRGRKLSADEWQVLEACAIPLVTGIARRRQEVAGASASDEVWHRSRWTVLAATSREARNQIAAARQALTAIATSRSDNLAAQLATAWRALYRIDRLAADLGALGRLHAGALETYLRPVDLDEVFAAVLDDLGPGGHDVTLASLENVPDVIADAALLTRILTSLLADALARSSGAPPPSITAESADGTVRIRITGCGKWTRPDPDGLPIRLARDLTEAMGDTLGCEQAPDGGWAVMITLPAAATGHRAAARAE